MAHGEASSFISRAHWPRGDIASFKVRPAGLVGRQPCRQCRPTSLGGGGEPRSGAGSNRGAPSGGA